ncbi:MAG: hypothetical protein CVV42_15565 [Candidatus Riflebacteria bacterium HGW-Riflebacteria-2]|jgi:hypothetical protein|nr:MAG: hypothetical protein CVV42_15565 [Candidatus Riflebacteria bacterium HGW-Riflebacteria-2]
MGETFNRNLSVLKRHPAAFQLINGYAPRFAPEKYRIENARNGHPTLILHEDSARPLSFHSRYDPQAEAKKQVAASYDGHSHILLLGFGLGYMAEEILQHLKVPVGGPQLFVVEPDPAVFVAAMQARDLSRFLSDQRVALCIGMGPDEIGDFWNANLDWTVLERLAIIDHPPAKARFNAYFERVVEKIRYLCNRSKGNLVTLMHSGFEFHSNYFANLAAGFVLPGVERLFGRFKNVPAVVVAAGPSLDRNMHQLKSVKGRFPIIAVDTALRQLVANGIRPDIVCAADPSYENSLDFVGVENETDVALAIEPMTHPDIFASFRGPKMLMTFGGGLHPVFKDLREPVGTLVCWGSIATTVFDLVRNMGADPIVFVGLDLSFEDGRLHARGSYSDDMIFERIHSFTSIEHESADYINTRGRYKLARGDGKVLFTDENMKLYRDWFEDQFRQTSAKIINATEGGVVDKYAEIMPLAEVIEKYANCAVPVREIIDEALHRPVKADCKALRERLMHYRKLIRRNESEARRAVSVCRRLLNAYSDVEPARLSGKASAEYYDVMKLHDDICLEKDQFAWFSIHQTRFITRHTMELNNLKAAQRATAGDWIKEVLGFLVALESFHEYQIPLLEEAIASLDRADKSQHRLKGDLSR